jgi:hypothetical protein
MYSTKKFFIVLATVLVIMLGIVGGVSAITDGELDGDGHPMVGLMVAQDAEGNPLWRCSGTMISPTIYLTAGHCTEPPAAHAEIWFDADVQSGIPANGYPNTGDVGGTTFTHPYYDPAAFYLYDLGVVELDEPVVLDEYGVLPEVDTLNQYKTGRGHSKLWFTAVGYGLQRSNPVFVEAERVRMVAYPRLIQINNGYVGDFSVLLSNNTNTGGTCFGDSGGPNFIKDSLIVGGVTSYGKNGNCAGTGGVYRVDKADDLDWLYAEFGDQLP